MSDYRILFMCESIIFCFLCLAKKKCFYILVLLRFNPSLCWLLRVSHLGNTRKISINVLRAFPRLSNYFHYSTLYIIVAERKKSNNNKVKFVKKKKKLGYMQDVCTFN